jgi:hypothetical protein
VFDEGLLDAVIECRKALIVIDDGTQIQPLSNVIVLVVLADCGLSVGLKIGLNLLLDGGKTAYVCNELWNRSNRIHKCCDDSIRGLIEPIYIRRQLHLESDGGLCCRSFGCDYKGLFQEHFHLHECIPLLFLLFLF